MPHDIQVALSSKRQAELRERIEMFNNKWATQLDKELKKQFHEKTYPEVAKMADTSMNIFRRIVREICTVYREPAERKMKGAAENQQAALDTIYRGMKIDATMQVAHRYAKAATISFIVVRPVEEGGRLVLRVLTPDQVYAEADPEDPTMMSLFAYASDVRDTNKKLVKIWTVYTDEERWFCNSAGKVLDKPKLLEVFGEEKAKDLEDPKNKYEIIPAVPFPAEFQICGFWNEDWNKDAAEANLKIGMLLTYMNYLVKTQSFKQIVISADKVDEKLKDSILDPLFPLLMSGNGQATTLDLNTRVDMIDQVIRGKVAAIANNYGISNENFTLTTQAASGFSLKIANQSLQDIREADIPLCASVEQALYKVIAKVAAIEDLGTFPEDGELQLNPGEVSWPEEWTTEQARWEFEFKNGVSSPVDYVIERDPQKSREEAIAYIQERQAEIKKLKPSMSAWDLVLQGNIGAGSGSGQAPGPGPTQALAGVALDESAPAAPPGQQAEGAKPAAAESKGALVNA